MADQGKKKTVLMVSEYGDKYDVPEANVQDFIEAGGRLAETEPPPTTGGLAGAVPAISKKVKSVEPSSWTKTAKDVISPFTDLLSGAVSSVAQAPVGVMRLATGIDPSKVQIPVELAKAGRGAAALTLGPAFGLGEAIAQAVKPKEDKTETTLAEAVKAPESAAGKTGEFITDIGTFAVPYSGVTKLPKVASFIEKAPKLARAADFLTSGAISSMQEYTKTGDWDNALDSAGLGMIYDAVFRSAGGLLKKASPIITRLASEKALPMKTKLGQNPEDVLNYHETLAKRVVDTASKFSRKGVKEIEDRFTSLVDGMKNASRESDNLVNELRSKGLINAGQAKMVDFRTPLRQAISDAYFKVKGTDVKDKLFDAYQKLINDLPSGKMTFDQAELEKERLNYTLATLYDSAKSDADIELAKLVKLKANDAIRRAHRAGLGNLESTVNSLVSSGAIPGNSPLASSQPWKVKVKGMKSPIDYKEAQRLSMQDADIMGAGWGALLKFTRQSDYSYYNPMSSSIALNQFIHGSMITPSQVATLYGAISAPTQLTRISSGLSQFMRKPPVTGRPPVLGRTAARITGGKDDENKPPITTSAQELIEDFSTPLNP